VNAARKTRKTTHSARNAAQNSVINPNLLNPKTLETAG
jgi:hypothetical protein